MFVGHAALSFAVVARVAAGRVGRRDGFVLGVVAAAFATVPDVDILYAPVGLVGARLDALALASAFWSTSTLVHRGVTHSLVVSALVALLAVSCFLGLRRRSRLLLPVAVAGGAALVAGVAADAGSLAAVVTVLYVASALGLAVVVACRTDLSGRMFAAAATFGLLSHPFGDVFTGTPPAFLYPFDAVLLADRVVLAGDPTLHLLAAFAVELGAIWLAALVLVGHTLDTDRGPRHLVRPWVAVAVVYATTVFVIPPPTLEYSYPFVFSVVAVGAVGAMPRVRLLGRRRVAAPDRQSALLTALSAVTVAWAAYLVAYLVV